MTTHHGDVPWLIAHVCNAPAIHRTLCNFCICVNFHSHLSLFSKDSPWDKLPLHCATKALQRCAEGNLVKIIKIKMTGAIIYISSSSVCKCDQNSKIDLPCWSLAFSQFAFSPEFVAISFVWSQILNCWPRGFFFSSYSLNSIHSYKNIFAGPHVFSIVLKICP